LKEHVEQVKAGWSMLKQVGAGLTSS